MIFSFIKLVLSNGFGAQYFHDEIIRQSPDKRPNLFQSNTHDAELKKKTILVKI